MDFQPPSAARSTSSRRRRSACSPQPPEKPKKALLFCVWAFVGLCISSVPLGAGLLVLGVEALTLWHIAPPRRREAILAALRSGPPPSSVS